MRLNNVTVQGGKGTSLVLPRVCECVAGSTEPSRLKPLAAKSTCPECGGRRSQAAEPSQPEAQGSRKLQDFLSAFV